MERIFLEVLKMSLVSCYIIIFVLIMRLLLRKAPKIFSYLLWSIVFVKLICPVTFEGVISLIPKQFDTKRIESAILLPDTDTNRLDAVGQSISPQTDEKSEQKLEVKTQNSRGILFFMTVLWLAGIAALACYSAISCLRLKKTLRYAIRLRDNLYEAAGIPTPFATGILKPRIYLPEALSQEESVYIIQHEQVHIQRRDYLIKLIAFMISCIHWFNPLVWFSYVLLSYDMELSCDERVIKKLGGGIKKQYSNSLLSLAVNQNMLGGMPVAFGERGVKGRIKHVLNYKRPAVWIILVSAISVGVVCSGLFFSPAAGKSNWKLQKQPVTLKNHVISDNKVTLYDGTVARLKLIMTKGVYYDEEYAGAGGGTYAENYNGSYKLQLTEKNGTVLSAINLNKDWDNASINFDGNFKLSFTDYNGDQCPDFTLGTYGSSSIELYYLYTITRNNKLTRIYQDVISDAKNGWSPVIEHKKENSTYWLYTKVYNNAVCEYQSYTYAWDAKTGYFKEKENTKPEEGMEELSSLFGKAHNYYFKSEYSGVDYDGDGLADRAELKMSNSNTKTITVSFGNGDTLTLTKLDGVTRDFKILGADLNGDGKNEIILINDIGAQGGDGMYRLSVYQKQGTSYQSLPLPEKCSMEEEGFIGFTYALQWDGKQAKLVDGENNEILALDSASLKEQYPDSSFEEILNSMQGKEPDTVYADGICDAVTGAEDGAPALFIKQYQSGLNGHADCIGYIITELKLNSDNSWKVQAIYYLPDQ